LSQNFGESLDVFKLAPSILMLDLDQQT